MPRPPLSRTLLAILPILGALLAGVAGGQGWPLPLSLFAMAIVASASAVLYRSAPLRSFTTPGVDRAQIHAAPEPPAMQELAAVVEPSAEIGSTPTPVLGSIGTRADSLATGKQYENDLLTGLLAPDAFFSRLRTGLERCRESRQSAILVLCDIDAFGEINRKVGLVEANTMLRQVADSFRLTVRDGDVLGRLGGDEFGIFFPGLPPEVAEHRVRDLRAAVREAGILTLPDDSPQVTACVGTSCFPDDGSDLDTLIAVADRTIAAAKRQRQENTSRPIASAVVLSRT